MAKTSVVNFLNHGVLKFSDNILIPRNGKEMTFERLNYF